VIVRCCESMTNKDRQTRAFICSNKSFQSVFDLVIHLWKEDVNGTSTSYQQFVHDDMSPISCNSTARIGHEIANIINSISINDILSLDVDLTHRWYAQDHCRAERTRIMFV
jgi:hypothetical protein